MIRKLYKNKCFNLKNNKFDFIFEFFYIINNKMDNLDSISRTDILSWVNTINNESI